MLIFVNFIMLNLVSLNISKGGGGGGGGGAGPDDIRHNKVHQLEFTRET